MVTERFFQNILRGRLHPEEDEEEEEEDEEEDEEEEEEEEVPGMRRAGSVRLDMARFTLLWKRREKQKKETLKRDHNKMLFLRTS